MAEAGPGGRRRETGAASARSLLLTVLGEFVLPTPEPAWTGALVGALAEVGVEEKAARQALARTAAEHLLVSERDGRRVRWHLTDTGHRLLAEGAARIYGFGRPAPAWDGRWLVLGVTVPESQRQLRHSLRTRLTWAGLGSPLPGVWVTPDAGKDAEVADVVRSLGVEAFTFVGPFGATGEPQRMVDQAWRLGDVRTLYRQFLDSVPQAGGDDPTEAFRHQVGLVQQWRRFPFLDPALPAELLPPDWPGQEAAEVFRARHTHWHGPAQAYWQTLLERAAARV